MENKLKSLYQEFEELGINEAVLIFNSEDEMKSFTDGRLGIFQSGGYITMDANVDNAPINPDQNFISIGLDDKVFHCTTKSNQSK